MGIFKKLKNREEIATVFNWSNAMNVIEYFMIHFDIKNSV